MASKVWRIARVIFATAALSAAGASAGQARLAEVTFDQYTPLAGNPELIRRSLTPLQAKAFRAKLAAQNLPLQGQVVELKNERFILRVPSARPPRGYGLLVFIPPVDGGSVPNGWEDALDRFGLIYVRSTHSGNNQSTIGRREPLAILAAYNVMKRYAVDPQRVFVAGFSGGARVAMRLALAYPDLFRGALMDAGSDPIGNDETPLPPRDLFERFRASTRLVYVSGALDQGALRADADSIASMQHWCIANMGAHKVSGLDHDVVTGTSLSAALSNLTEPTHDSGPANACWSRRLQELQSKIDRAAAQLRRGDSKAARDSLGSIDREYGGVAGTEIVDLDR